MNACDWYDFINKELSRGVSLSEISIIDNYPSYSELANRANRVMSDSLFAKPGTISHRDYIQLKEHETRLNEHYKQLEEVKSFNPPKDFLDELHLEDGRSFKEILNDIEEACQEWIDATTLIKDTNLLNIK